MAKNDAPGSPAKMPSSSGPLALPAQFGRYRLVKELGKGGMGTVYLAEDALLGRQVALKVPQFAPEAGPAVLDRFEREARAAATLDHPNICRVYDVGQIDGIHYLTMEYLEGKPLAAFVRPDKPQPPQRVAALIRKLALALQEAHAKGIVHRDLKPSNIMINQRKEPVIMDFGLARRISSSEARLTKIGALVGTPAYMAPEQLSGDPSAIGPACDIYSLGVILYEFLSGKLPFEGPVFAILGQILSQPPEPPSKVRPDVDPPLEAICLKALAKDPKDRFASMAEFAQALAEYLQVAKSGPAAAETASNSLFATVGPVQPPRSSGPARRWLVLWIVTAAAVAVLAGVVLGIVLMRPTPPPPVQVNVQVVVAIDAALTVTIDGEPLTKESGAEPLKLKAGEHTLTIQHDGQPVKPGDKVRIGGEERQLVVKLGGQIIVGERFTVQPGDRHDLQIQLVKIAGEQFTLRTTVTTGPGSNDGVANGIVSITLNDNPKLRQEAVFPNARRGVTTSSDLTFPCSPASVRTITVEYVRYDAWRWVGVAFEFLQDGKQVFHHEEKIDQWFSGQPKELKAGAKTKMTFEIRKPAEKESPDPAKPP